MSEQAAKASLDKMVVLLKTEEYGILIRTVIVLLFGILRATIRLALQTADGTVVM